VSEPEPMFIGTVYNFVYLSTNLKCDQVYGGSTTTDFHAKILPNICIGINGKGYLALYDG